MMIIGTIRGGTSVSNHSDAYFCQLIAFTAVDTMLVFVVVPQQRRSIMPEHNEKEAQK